MPSFSRGNYPECCFYSPVAQASMERFNVTKGQSDSFHVIPIHQASISAHASSTHITSESLLRFILCYKTRLLFISKAISRITITAAYGLLISFKCRECLSHRKFLTDERMTVPDHLVSKLSQKDIKSIHRVWELNSHRSSEENKVPVSMGPIISMCML